MEENVTLSPVDFPNVLNTSVQLGGISLGDSGTTYTHSTHLVIMRADFWMALVTLSVLASLGIVGNLSSIVVWSTDKAFNAVVFLFKYLAVWDTAYLAAVITYNLIIRDRELAANQALKLSVYHGSGWVQLVSVHVTLLIAVNRWIAVTFPLRAVQYLSSRRVYVSSMLITVYCAVLQSAQALFNSYYPKSALLFIIKRVLGLALPFVLLLIFNISLLWTAVPHFKKKRETIATAREKDQSDCTNRKASLQERNTTPTSSESETQGATVFSFEEETCVTPKAETNPDKGAEQESLEQPNLEKEGLHHHQQLQQQQQPQQQQHQKTPNRSPRIHHFQCTKSQQSHQLAMIKVVLLVSLCSFIAYPIGTSVQIYAIKVDKLSMLTRYIIMHTASIFQVINSGINALIYWFFVSKFRMLAKNLQHKLRLRLQSVHAPAWLRR